MLNIILESKFVTNKLKDIYKIKGIFKYFFPKEGHMPFFIMMLLTKVSKMEFISFHHGDILGVFVYMASSENITFVTYLSM